MRGAGFEFPDARLLVFAKAPIPGVAKTRMIPALGADGAARLQGQLLASTIQRFAGASLAPIELWCAPDDSHPAFREVAERFGVGLRVQRGANLGERMLSAARDASRRAAAVVLVGCDCPDLGPAEVREALGALLAPEAAPESALSARLDAVLGPASDGGYVLLALKRPEPALFEDIPWGGDQVAVHTRERLRRLDWRWRELAELRDLDRPDDLAWYEAR
jgi:rSAM/selenodomain-associated transferase 1